MNRKYKYFVFGDVHGEFLTLVSELQDAGWDFQNPKHILISLGDNFDRGDDNVKIYEFLRKYKALTIKGNHEDFFLNYLIGYDNGLYNSELNGMWWTLRSFSNIDLPTEFYDPYLKNLRYVIEGRHPQLISWISNMPAGYKIGEYILTHAGFNTLYQKHEEDKDWLPNNGSNTPKFIKKYSGHTGNFKFIFGHWHAFRLTKEFIGIDDAKSSIFEYENFIGLDACSNLTKRVNIYIIESDSEAIPFSRKHNLKEIKEL